MRARREIPGLGIDVVDISDFAATLTRSGERFTAEVFTTGETAYCQGRRPQHYAARWAAKEAFFKAAGGSLPRDTRYQDVEVVLNAARAPGLRLSGAAARWARAVGVASAALSLAHSRRTAVAAVILRYRLARAAPPAATRRRRGARRPT